MENRGRSTTNVAEYLRGIDFPCSRNDLINHCRLHNCPSDVVNTIESLPNRQYNSMADVMSGIGQVE